MSFTAASYNILADAYIRPSFYPRVEPVALMSEHRRPPLLERVGALGAEVICLQEVELDVFEALARRLEPRGYRALFARKGGDKPDGLATFVRRDTLGHRGMRTLFYRDGVGGEGDSGHLALVALLEHERRPLAIVNTHLKWEPPDLEPGHHWGRRQVRHLLAERAALDPEAEAWILCGDLNATPESDVVSALLGEGFTDAYCEQPDAFTCNSNSRAKRIDYLLHTGALSARPDQIRCIDDLTPLPSPEEPSDHLAVSACFSWAAPPAATSASGRP